MAKIMPYTITDNDHTSRTNTGHALRWNCSVRDCTHSGTGNGHDGVERIAARHSASHTETELASTGYQVRVNWAALAAQA